MGVVICQLEKGQSSSCIEEWERGRTWFSSQMVMNLSKDLPPGVSWNLAPVPSAWAHSEAARATSNKGEKDFMATMVEMGDRVEGGG